MITLGKGNSFLTIIRLQTLKRINPQYSWIVLQRGKTRISEGQFESTLQRMRSYAPVTTQPRWIGASTHSLNSFRYRKQCHFSSQEWVMHRGLQKSMKKRSFPSSHYVVFWGALKVRVLKSSKPISYKGLYSFLRAKNRDAAVVWDHIAHLLD
jgi:hypothetical protein